MVIYRKRRSRSWRSKSYTTTTWRTSGRELLLFWHLWSRARLTYNTRQAPVHLPPPCYFKTFLTCLMHYVTRSCMLNKLLYFLPWEFDNLSLIPLFYKKVFLMLSLALEKQNVLFLTKRWCFKWVGCFQNKTWWWIHHGRDGFNIGKDVPLLDTKLWVENNKTETGWLTCTRRESRCSVFV
jgi:hypothetical protein